MINYKEQRNGIPENIKLIGSSAYDAVEDVCYEDLVKNNEPLKDIHTWTADEIFTIIYTSGTTGNAKGVMHRTSSFGPGPCFPNTIDRLT